MLCFEVYRNGTKLCTAGIGEFGVLTAIMTLVSHRPEKLALWRAKGIEDEEATNLNLRVGGLISSADPDQSAQLTWVNVDLSCGDDIRIRVIESPHADSPTARPRDEPSFIDEKEK